MSSLVYLIPAALLLGATALGAFLWSLKNDQYDDMQGAAEVVGLTIAEYVPRQAMAVQRLLNGLPLI